MTYYFCLLELFRIECLLRFLMLTTFSVVGNGIRLIMYKIGFSIISKVFFNLTSVYPSTAVVDTSLNQISREKHWRQFENRCLKRGVLSVLVQITGKMENEEFCVLQVVD